jgi:hypothetical protein
MRIKAVFLDIGNVLLTNGWDRGLDLLGIHHTSYESTRDALAARGLKLED